MASAPRTSKPPRDPRARRIVRAEVAGDLYMLTLDCGHSARCEVKCPPARIICQRCPK